MKTIFCRFQQKTIQFPAIYINIVLIILPKRIVHPLQNNHQVNPCRGTRQCLTREAGRGSYGGSRLTVASGPNTRRLGAGRPPDERPTLVSAPDVINEHVPVSLITALTSQKPSVDIHSRCEFEPPAGGLTQRSKVLLIQLRVVDKHRVTGCYSTVSDAPLRCVEDALQGATGWTKMRRGKMTGGWWR